MKKAIHVIVLLYIRAMAYSFYEELGLNHDHNISTNEIEFTFQKLLKELQPKVDKGELQVQLTGDGEAAQKLYKIRRAHDVLTNRSNNYGDVGLYKYETGEGEIRRDKGSDAQADIEVTLEELFKGTQRSNSIKKNVICPKCSGTGAKDGKMKTCTQCGGRGVVMVNVGGGFGGFSMQMQQHCPSCGGRGKIYKDTCPHCRGQKVVPDEKDLIIRVKPGTLDRDKVIFTRESEQRPGMTPGDVVFTIRERPHPVFIRAGNDLYMKLEVGLKEAITGFTRKVKSISGKEITISGGKDKLLIRIPGEGMPEKKRPSKRGDLIVQVKVRLPSYLSHEQQQLIQEIF